MTENKTASGESRVWRPCTRALFVYYLAMAIAFFGPLINPAVGVPVWLGWLVGLLIVARVVYHLLGQEYRATPQGLMKIWRWPRREEFLAWEKAGAVELRRGLTQTLLQVGNVVVPAKSGGGRMFWYGLLHPKEVKAALEEMRPPGEEAG